MWWNFIGLVVTSAVAVVVSAFAGKVVDEIPAADHGSTVASVARSPYTIALVSIFGLIVVISTFLKDTQSWFLS
jgi:hypothetical protein